MKEIGPESWNGYQTVETGSIHVREEQLEAGMGDLPGEVRRANTTGGTNQHHKSKEMKDGPDGLRRGNGKDEQSEAGYTI